MGAWLVDQSQQWFPLKTTCGLTISFDAPVPVAANARLAGVDSLMFIRAHRRAGRSWSQAQRAETDQKPSSWFPRTMFRTASDPGKLSSSCVSRQLAASRASPDNSRDVHRQRRSWTYLLHVEKYSPRRHQCRVCAAPEPLRVSRVHWPASSQPSVPPAPRVKSV